MQALGDAASMAFSNVSLVESLRAAGERKDAYMTHAGARTAQPLGPIRNALHVLRLRPGDANAIEQARAIMDRQVTQLGRLVDDLLDASRLNHVKITLQPVRLDLVRLVREMADDRRALMQVAGLTLRVDLPSTPIWVTADPARLAQAIDNVIDNARKFTPTGGVVSVSLTLAPDGLYAELSVFDTGVGVSPEIATYVFDAFVQEDRSLDRAGGGLGLGLAITKELLELHGGRIELTSAGRGRGAAFRIYLPAEAAIAALVESAPPAPAARKQARVLVVEDNEDAAESLRVLLDISGYEVTVAHTGPQAISTAASTDPQVILCDIGLPEMDGLAVARVLRKTRESARAHMIAVTGYGSDEDIARSLGGG